MDEVVKFDNNELPIVQHQKEFVKVSFKLNKIGEVEILNMNYSDEAVKERLVEKLSKIKIEGNTNAEEVYYYNFRFEKR